jgi:ribosome-associated protein
LSINKIVKKAAQLAWTKKGQDVLIMDLRKITNVTDYFIVVSGESDIHVKAIAEHIERELKKEKIKIWHKEGFQKLNWVLLDYIEFVVHIFKPEVREFYSLEKLWADANITTLDNHVKSPILSEARS